MSIEYITDESGERKAVIIPIDEWNQIKSEYNKLKIKLRVMNGVKTTPLMVGPEQLAVLNEIKPGLKSDDLIKE